MPRKTSFCNGTLLRSDLRHYWPAGFLYVLVWLVLLPIPLLQTGFDYARSWADRPELLAAELHNIYYSAMTGSMVLAVLAGIVMPMAANMMLTIFLLSFAWQWTDVFYSPLFFPQFNVLANTVSKVTVITSSGVGAGSNLASILVNTATIMLIVPLLLLYLVAQRYFMQGIERSGLVG